MINPFKVCSCGARWSTREEFLKDPSIQLVGYQADFEDLRLGLFLFNHSACRTTLALPAGLFRDLYDGPIFVKRATGGPTCQGYCLHRDNLDPCPAECECAYVREILQRLRKKPPVAA
ncbi:MAG: hypothetical protein U1E27_04260 [Kiritimatiellia bacterium]|nr:hypothetical protein [Kiritimatiellia bacterium]